MELLSVIHPPRPCGSEALDPFARLLIWSKPTMLAAADRPSPSGARFERKTRVQTGTKNLRVGFPNPDRLT